MHFHNLEIKLIQYRWMVDKQFYLTLCIMNVVILTKNLTFTRFSLLQIAHLLQSLPMFAWCVFICTLILCYAFCTKKLYQTRVHGTEHMLNNISLKQKYPRNIIYWKTLIARPTQKQAYRVYNSQKHMFFTVYDVVKYKKWVRSRFLGTTFLCWNCSNRMNEKFEISTIK